MWQMYKPGKRPVNGPLSYWNEAAERPGAAQMQYVRKLIGSRSYLSRVPDQNLIADPPTVADTIVATRGDGYAMIYSAQGRKFQACLEAIGAKEIRAWWFDPRNGSVIDAGRFPGSGDREFTCPSEGFGSDWVLALDDASKGFREPGR